MSKLQENDIAKETAAIKQAIDEHEALLRLFTSSGSSSSIVECAKQMIRDLRDELKRDYGIDY